MIGLKIMMTHGNYLAVSLELPEAIKLINAMANSTLPDRISNTNVKCQAGSTMWALVSKEIVGMHTFDLNQANQGQMPAQGGFNPSYGRSGM